MMMVMGAAPIRPGTSKFSEAPASKPESPLAVCSPSPVDDIEALGWDEVRILARSELFTGIAQVCRTRAVVGPEGGVLDYVVEELRKLGCKMISLNLCV